MKIIKRILIIIIGAVLIFEISLAVTGNLYVNRVLYMTILSGKTGPDIDELNLFPKQEIKNTIPQPWSISNKFGQITITDDRLRQMEKLQTVSFLVIKDDSLLFEKHWEGYDNNSYVNSFSMAKSINALLIGCALKDGLIKSIDDPVGNYLDEFKTGEKSKITIKHLLTMSSGLDFKEEYLSLFAWPAEAYYGKDVNALTLKADVVTEPGKTWSYKGGDSQLLGIILKKVLNGKSIAEYASEKLWKPIGAEHPAYWSTDEKGMEKVSCCWYTNVRDYARIVKLMLNQGSWNGVQIIDSTYITTSLQPADYLIDIDDKKPINKYGYQWWLMNYKGHDIFYMRGIRGQYAFGIPDLNIIVVRLGHKRAPKKDGDLPSDIFLYLDATFDIIKYVK